MVLEKPPKSVSIERSRTTGDANPFRFSQKELNVQPEKIGNQYSKDPGRGGGARDKIGDRAM